MRLYQDAVRVEYRQGTYFHSGFDPLVLIFCKRIVIKQLWLVLALVKCAFKP